MFRKLRDYQRSKESHSVGDSSSQGYFDVRDVRISWMLPKGGEAWLCLGRAPCSQPPPQG